MYLNFLRCVCIYFVIILQSSEKKERVEIKMEREKKMEKEIDKVKERDRETRRGRSNVYRRVCSKSETLLTESLRDSTL